MPWSGGGFEFPEYVSVGTRRARARAAAEKIARKQKRSLAPVGPIGGNKLVRTFWGKAWCHNLESYRDYENRLPRGRSYVRHGAVIDLQIGAGKVTALVSGTSTYEVDVTIRSLAPKSWSKLASECTRQIDSLVDLPTRTAADAGHGARHPQAGGLFPSPNEITFECSCPDWAGMCKHIAAALYGVGVRLEEKPELFFELRGVDHSELVWWCPRRGRPSSRGRSQAPQGREGRFSIFRRSSESSWSQSTGQRGRNRQHRRRPGIGPTPEPTFRGPVVRSPRKEPTQVRSRTRSLLRLGAQGGAQNRK